MYHQVLIDDKKKRKVNCNTRTKRRPEGERKVVIVKSAMTVREKIFEESRRKEEKDTGTMNEVEGLTE